MKVPKALAKFWWLVGLWNLGLCYTVRTVRSIAVQGQSIFDHNGMVNGFCLCTIVFNGFSKVANHWTSDGIVMMFFSIARPTIGFRWFLVRQPLDPMVFQWFPMVANHWLVKRWNGNDPSLGSFDLQTMTKKRRLGTLCEFQGRVRDENSRGQSQQSVNLISPAFPSPAQSYDFI